ncbi:cytochrome c biogenesis heme-transporting ATPase CcmA [Candidatus Vesicomyidisocius sp. SY067_SCS001]|uniref:cytochrome c biogenesis heme-transporting ATPase CcmA n=1 Tax=Candidatus Vesicomyidisocius sp. SY067_SCS001 TaxID=2732590 RepID=UPI0016849348|nr:cytochrome c biogenesis heme-transporting ATPase CcmA [Candidatus Vesicomyosocius sp. SY067_SCS001]
MLKVDNLSCQKGYNLLFSNLSFKVNSGDILRITGTNGSGKTSLLKILAGLDVQEQGNVFLDNHKLKSEAYQKEIFYLGHLSALSQELSTLENLEFLTELNKSTKQIQLTKALKSIGLKGYENEYCDKLSAGQKRRVILAGLFISNAKIWLLDEPFTALDTEGVTIIESRITKHCKQGGLCLFTTHQNSNLLNQKVLEL